MFRGLLFFLFLLPQLMLAQVPEIGSWRDHLPYSGGRQVVAAGNKIFCATDHSLFYFDRDDNSINRLSKVNGLSDVGLLSLAYDDLSGFLIIGYLNGNIDLISSADLSKVNLSDIKRSNLIGDKSINHILPIAGQAYLSTGFGIVLLDLLREEIKETYYLAPSGSSVQVNAICLRSDTLFAASEKGVYKAFRNNPFLSDYTSWTKDLSLPSSVRDSSFSGIVEFNNELVAVFRSDQFSRDSVYRNNGSSWSLFSPMNGNGIHSLRVNAGQLIFSQLYAVTAYDASFTQIQNIFSYPFGGIAPRDAIYNSGFYWIADGGQGLVKAVDSWTSFALTPDGPRSASAAELSISEGDVWVAPGVVSGAAWLNTYNNDFVSCRYEEDWTTVANFQDPNSYFGQDSLFDAISVAADPENSKHAFVGSMSYFGLVEILDGVLINTYDEKNSPLPQWSGRPGYCGISALNFDDEGNLWMCLPYSTKPVAVRKTDGSFVVYDLDNDIDNRVYREMLCSEATGLKWIAMPTTAQSGGLFVWDDKKTIHDPSDDQFYMYSTGIGYGNLPSTDVYCLAEDFDEEIWIGTGAGVAVVYNQDAYFTGGNFDAQQILIQQDGNTQILLETEVVTAIAVDGANRKWIGTEGSGVYLMSDDGTEQLLHFTADNSPLLSNQINDIKIDHSNGEVYFATSQGIISYRGTATIEDPPYDSLYAFPNPVLPEYDGLIAIKGMSRDADVKITDIAGNVVYVARSEGGQAIWNGRNMKGEKVAAGIYTALCKNPYGKGRGVAKILIIR